MGVHDMSGDAWRTRGPLNTTGAAMAAAAGRRCTVDPLPATLEVGDRFENPSVAHHRWAGEIGLRLVKDGDAWEVRR